MLLFILQVIVTKLVTNVFSKLLIPLFSQTPLQFATRETKRAY